MTDFSKAIKQKNKSTLIDISVTPNARRTEIKGFDSWRKRILVGVKEQPTRNRANREVIGFFSKLFATDVEIVSGAKSSQKTLEVPISAEVVKEVLNESK